MRLGPPFSRPRPPTQSPPPRAWRWRNWTGPRVELMPHARPSRHCSPLKTCTDLPTAKLAQRSIEEAAGNRQAELEHWQKVVDLDGSNVFALNNLAYILLNYAKRPDEALKYAMRAHQLAPENSDIEDTLGWVLYLKGVYPTALEHLEHAVSSDGNRTGPNFTVRKYHLAMACFKNGDRTRGLRVFESAHKLDPDTPEARMAEALKDAPK